MASETRLPGMKCDQCETALSEMAKANNAADAAKADAAYWNEVANAKDEANVSYRDEFARLRAALAEAERDLDSAREALQRIGELIGAPTFADIRGHDKALALYLQNRERAHAAELARKDAALREFFAVYDAHPDVYAVQRALNMLRAALASPTAEKGTT